MKAFVTGGTGFVGGWLGRHLRQCGDDVAIADDALDITDGPALVKAVEEVAPDAVYHLAALTHVGESWEAPEETFRVNAMGTLSLVEAVRHLPQSPRVLLVSSAEVYGVVTADDLPLTESSPLRPTTPYAVSKVAAEFVAMQAFLAHGLPVVTARAFNHAGPGQSPSFVVSSLARQVAGLERTGGAVLRVGSLTPRRDLTDVRDVVRAYRLLVERGTPGGVYQVCSGVAVAVQEIADRLLAIAGTDAVIELDPELVRPVDVPVLVGDPDRLHAATGWEPGYELDETLTDTLNWWRETIALDEGALE
jgi:GDP-4-dehydro-6-deoxy-D-mannose reductase